MRKIIRLKIRSDKGGKHKKYAGKPVKRYKRIRYAKKKGRKQYLKIWVWEKKPMSSEGRRRFPSYIRPYVKPVIFKFGQRFDVPIFEIGSRKMIEDWCVKNIGYPGDFYLMGFTGTKKNKYHVKPTKLCHIRITEHPEGLHAIMVRDFKLFRYRWFYHT